MKRLNDLQVLRRHISCITQFCTSQKSCSECEMLTYCSSHEGESCLGRYFHIEGKKALSVVERAIKSYEK